jgi:hypothetical protein
MSEPGFIAVHRSIWNHDLFADKVFGEREAWLWLVSAAAWQDCKVRSGNAMVDIKRGQLLFATRFLAKKWKWSHTTTVRFLNLLENETMIGTHPGPHATLITICNYDKYQLSGNEEGTQDGTQDGTQTVRSRYKEEELNNKRIDIPRAPALVFETDWPKDYREVFWQSYPKRVDKAAALRKLDQIRRGAKVPWAALIGGVQRYAESVRGKDQQYTKGPAAWLNAGKWDDEIKSNNSIALPGGQRVEGWV